MKMVLILMSINITCGYTIIIINFKSEWES